MLAILDTVETELVVLLDEQRRAVGSAPKRLAHHAETPLHLGFSCYVLDAAGRVLVTQRAATKRSFARVWTNTVCGHPGPGEEPADAVSRRARYELGLQVCEVQLALPDFRYRAEQDGVVENEWCPVFLARTTGQPTPEPSEVDAYRWTSWEQLLADVDRDPGPWSPWCLDQIRLLEHGGLLRRYRAQSPATGLA